MPNSSRQKQFYKVRVQTADPPQSERGHYGKCPPMALSQAFAVLDSLAQFEIENITAERGHKDAWVKDLRLARDRLRIHFNRLGLNGAE